MTTPSSFRPRIGLLFRTESKGQFFHIIGHPVYIGHLYAEDVRAADELSSIDENDPLSAGYHLADMCISCQGNNDARGRHLYAFAIEYRHVSCIDEYYAKRMHSTLTKLAKRMRDLRDRFGAPESFYAYIAHVCNALRINTIIIDSRAYGKDAGRAHQVMSLADGLVVLRNIEFKWLHPTPDRNDNDATGRCDETTPSCTTS